jgi:hypothetical protein
MLPTASSTSAGIATFPTSGGLTITSGSVAEAQPITTIGSGLSLSSGTLSATGGGGGGGGVSIVSSLPAATSSTRGNLYLLSGGGTALDSLYVGAEGAGTKYGFLQVGLSGIVSPLDIPGCVWWLDASQISGVSNNTGLSSWTDESSNGYTVAQSTSANQPLYKTSQQNGLAGVYFNPTTNASWMSTAHLPLSGSGAFTIFFVTKLTNYQADFFTSGNLSSNGFIFAITPAANTEWVEAGVGTYTFGASSIASNATVAEIVSNGSSASYYENGSLIASSVTCSLNSLSTAQTTLGYPAVPYTGGWNMYEVIFYNSQLTTIQRQLVENYLINKWGLP